MTENHHIVTCDVDSYVATVVTYNVVELGIIHPYREKDKEDKE